jgi:predicted acylesterase/phospholipase RssA
MSGDADERKWVDGVIESMRTLRGAGAHAKARRVGEEAEASRKPALSNAGLERLRVARALATYKDTELPMRAQLREAQALVEPFTMTSVDPETLGVAGAIERRFYELQTRVEHLERALAFYLRGHELDVQADWPSAGYPGINAAYLLEMIASIEQASGLPLQIVAAADRRQKAEALRTQLLDKAKEKNPAPDRQYWFLATLAEAAVGGRDFKRAREKIELALELKPDPGMIASTAKQLARLLRLQQADGQVSPEGRQVLHALVGESEEAVSSSIRGRLGLALSGGGFRASFFHIGVLARLAEVDLLRHVEVLSCVSGGSLVGALYALELKHLYESKPDGTIGRVDFVELVARLAARFREAVSMNIRTRVALSAKENWAMLTNRRSRSHRAADLYEEYLYARVGEGDGRYAGPRYMKDLAITLKETPAFKRSSDNWLRKNKVPQVVFNATTLNTGHVWHFTPDSMGEPPAREEDVDVNDRFVRMPYGAFGDQFEMRLGHAVAASACVPGLFEPLAVEGAYAGPTPLLVDGGVHDNQGTVALLEQECTMLIVSDASGQLGTVDAPSNSALASLLRSDSVFQARIREAQYQDLIAREQGKLLFARSFLHLKQGFARREIRAATGAAPLPAPPDAPLPYAVSRDVQERLAALRTDLDAFSPLEAESLMASGYLIAENGVDPARYEAPPPNPDRFDSRLVETWFDFLRVRPLLTAASLKRSPTQDRVLSLLHAGENMAGKAFLIDKSARRVGVAILAVLAVALIALMWHLRHHVLMHVTVGGGAVLLGVALLRRLRPEAGLAIDLLRQPTAIVTAVVRPAVLAVVGSLAARAQLRWADRAFLAAGKVEPLLEALASEPPAAAGPPLHPSAAATRSPVAEQSAPGTVAPHAPLNAHE